MSSCVHPACSAIRVRCQTPLSGLFPLGTRETEAESGAVTGASKPVPPRGQHRAPGTTVSVSAVQRVCAELLFPPRVTAAGTALLFPLRERPPASTPRPGSEHHVLPDTELTGPRGVVRNHLEDGDQPKPAASQLV